MKVLNLQCGHGHAFEGWFGSEDAFQDQLGRGLVECPLCGDVSVAKMPSAPRLNLGAAAPAQPAAKQEVVAGPEAQQLQAAWMKMVRHVMANTEDVGERFAEEARKIHYGEAGDRGIRGQASREETESLLEEGISVMPLPVPKGLKGPLQ
jgi:hypothetical protein